MKPKIGRRKEIKIRAEINKMENDKKEINKPKTGSLRKSIKFINF